MKLEVNDTPAAAAPRTATPMPGERRRPKWGEFRNSYPGIVATMTIAMFAFFAIDMWLVYKYVHYRNEIGRLRGGMTDVERSKTDLLLKSDENRLQVMIALVRRQAVGDRELHLSIDADSGIMHLEREGARLRDMRIELGPEKAVGIAPDTVHLAVPRGTRTVERVLSAGANWDVPSWVFSERGLPVPGSRSIAGALGKVAVLLDGGTVIYSLPAAGPLADSSYVLPGSVRAKAADLEAVAPNLKPGMKVYFY
jgi:hypothetical protein